MKKQTGFTLIELIVVILILGILAATALPRFIDINQDAHQSAVNGAGGALGASMALIHAQWVARGGTATVNSVTLEDGTVVTTNDNGWADNDDDPATTPAAANCVTLWQQALQGNGPAVAPAGPVTEGYVATNNGATACVYTYYQNDSTNTARTITYDTANGQVVIVNAR